MDLYRVIKKNLRNFSHLSGQNVMGVMGNGVKVRRVTPLFMVDEFPFSFHSYPKKEP